MTAPDHTGGRKEAVLTVTEPRVAARVAGDAVEPEQRPPTRPGARKGEGCLVSAYAVDARPIRWLI